KSEIRRDQDPSAGLVLRLERKPARGDVPALPDRDVDAAVGWIDPPVGKQPGLSVCGDLPAKIDAHEMVLADTLILAEPERRQVAAIPSRDHVSNILAELIPGVH